METSHSPRKYSNSEVQSTLKHYLGQNYTHTDEKAKVMSAIINSPAKGDINSYIFSKAAGKGC